MAELHLVATESAAGCLRCAIKEYGLSGTVFCVKDALDVGPLNDGRQRMAFWCSLAAGYSLEAFDEADEFSGDAFTPWGVLLDEIKKTPPTRIVIWTSGSGADYVFLRMACHRLADTAIPISVVRVSASHDDRHNAPGHHSVAVHTPQALASYAATAAGLTDAGRKAFAQEFDAIAGRPELLRACDASGHLVFLDISAHDDLLVKARTLEWRQANRVVGDAMGAGDPRNSPGDVFLCSRLQHLIDAGQIEADAPRTVMSAYRVRLRRT